MSDDLDDAWAAIVIEERAEVLRLRKRIEELEATLAKAVGVLKAIRRAGDYLQHYSKRVDDIATRTLAELGEGER